MNTLLVHPGTQYSFRLAGQLERHGCLRRFWTGLAYISTGMVGRGIGCLPRELQRRVANRRLEGVPAQKLRLRSYLELKALYHLRAGCDDQTVAFERNAAFQKRIPNREIAGSDVVIGFDTSSWILAQRASAMGRPLLLDQSIGHPLSFQAILPILKREFPEWSADVPARLPELAAAEKSEHQMAHRIVAASSFTRRTLIENGVPPEKIVVNPYGVDLDAFTPATQRASDRPLRFVFLGSLGSRKGVPLLLRAWRSLAPREAELWLVGPLSPRHAALIPEIPGVKLVGKVPHYELPELLRQCDVLVLPSYFEGFGLVLLEALATGLPIIATDATAAPDLITEGEEGYVVPAGNEEALRHSIQRFLNSPDDVARMSLAARRRAEHYSWDSYGDRWADLLSGVA